MKSMLLLLVVFFLGITISAAQYFVDPENGSDQNVGTIKSPFRTLEKARNVIQAINVNMKQDIIVYLRKGNHPITSTFTLDEKDQGHHGFKVIYKAYDSETVILEAGQKVSGWQQIEVGLWKASGIKIADFRQLYVNGRRANRARSTVKYSGVAWPRPYTSFISVGDTAQYYPDGIKISNKAIKPTWGNPQDIELVWIGEESRCTWRSHRLLVNALVNDGTDSTIIKLDNYGYVMTGSTTSRPMPENPFYIENALELLDQPGEWYFDKSSRNLFYMPREGEDMKTAEVYIPGDVQTIISIKGSSLDNKAGNIQFEGLTFRHTTWLRPNSTRWGACSNQADKYVNGFRQRGVAINAIDWFKPYFDPKIDWELDANGEPEGFKPNACVELDAAEDIVILNCRFEHLGAVGIDLSQGCNKVEIIGNVFRDLSGTAIIVGRWDQDYIAHGEEVCKHVAIRNNLIQKIGQEYYNSPAITAFHTEAMHIAHNEISDVPYSGISSGWGSWGGRTSWTNSNRLNIIEYNLIKNIGQKCSDGGGIYTIGIGKASTDPDSIRSKIRFNYIVQTGLSYGALYPDEGSCYYDFVGNVLEDVENSERGKWLHLQSSRTHHIKIDGNYSNSAKFLNKGVNCLITDHTEYNGHNRPHGALGIIGQAGLTEGYK